MHGVGDLIPWFIIIVELICSKPMITTINRSVMWQQHKHDFV